MVGRISIECFLTKCHSPSSDHPFPQMDDSQDLPLALLTSLSKVPESIDEHEPQVQAFAAVAHSSSICGRSSKSNAT